MRIRRGFAFHSRTRLCIVAVSLATAALVVSDRVGAPEPPVSEPNWQDVYERWGLEVIIVAPGFYTVQEGEQLSDVAAKYKLPGPLQLTIDVLREINGLWDNSVLRPGQRLRVPEMDLEQWPIWAQKRWAQDVS